MATPSPDASNPLAALLQEFAPLDNSFGAILIGTYVTLVLYGLTVHQAFRYFRIYKRDLPRLKFLVTVLLVADTLYAVFCVHTCYYYLVRNYFKPAVLKKGIWSLQLLAPTTGVIIVLSQSFYSRRVSLMGSWYKTLVSIVIFLMVGETAFIVASTVEAFWRAPFETWHEVAWMTSAAWSFAVAVETLLSTTLIIVLRRSRTGFKRTDSVLDILTGYTINTGLLTGTASALCLTLALVFPKNLIYMATNMVTTMLYSNSTLAVLNSRKFLADRAVNGFDPTGPSFDWSGMQQFGTQEQQPRSPQSVVHIRPRSIVERAARSIDSE